MQREASVCALYLVGRCALGRSRQASGVFLQRPVTAKTPCKRFLYLVWCMLELCMFAEASKHQEEISLVGTLGKAEAFAPSHGVRQDDLDLINYRLGIRGPASQGKLSTLFWKLFFAHVTLFSF